ncbi:rho GTPase-activating protein 3 [Corylus avellana]|uniref:rho GTPase-activating protein 3 n=1 Tax=Corylus avellana TaxID=13451 RepID=UPI00286A4BD8|nr:rho GTPase-activating protein 3 [Corylus avellana]
MTRLFRSKSCGLVGLTEFNSDPVSPFYNNEDEQDEDGEEEEEEEEEDEQLEDEDYGDDVLVEPISTTPFITPGSRTGDESSEGRQHCNGAQFPVLDILVAALRKSLLVTCSVEREDVSSVDISWPTEVRHVSHVTFDRFNGFLGLPTELEPEVPKRVPSASASVFGVSAKSMQCSYDARGNSVPTILLMMQKRLYSEGGLSAEGIFRINAENSQEENVRDQLNKGVVPRGIDVHCLAGLIKAWLRELPTGVLDSVTPEQVLHCNTEDDCVELIKLLPPTEAALLDWAINLMADVVQHEQFNKMNARNIAMVFAPNMTQMADPLTALIHAVQVMNFLKTLILKTIREREKSVDQDRRLSSYSDLRSHNDDPVSSNLVREASSEQPSNTCPTHGRNNSNFLRTTTLNRLESDTMEKLWSFEKNSNGEEALEYMSSDNSPTYEMGDLENRSRSGYDSGDWLNLRKGVRKLCRHPVFQLNKPAKKNGSLGIVNTRGGGGEAWA